MLTIINASEYARDAAYILYTPDGEGNLWFFSAWGATAKAKAEAQAREFGKCIARREDCELEVW